MRIIINIPQDALQEYSEEQGVNFAIDKLVEYFRSEIRHSRRSKKSRDAVDETNDLIRNLDINIQ